MKKDDCERAIRHLCSIWAMENGYRREPDEHPDFTAFFAWLQDNYSAYLRFRTSTSVRRDVEQWFDEEFRQTWRN